MSSENIGPRRRALLEAWGNTVSDIESGPGFDFTDNNRTHRTQDQVTSFLNAPSDDQFRDLWSYEILADAVIGGPELVLNQCRGVEEVADTIEEIRAATTYDPGWEATFPVDTAVWELYGRLHPESAPILYSECTRGLKGMGHPQPGTFAEAKEAWSEFDRLYDDHVGYATRGTGHEVPRHHEMSELLRFVATQDDDVIADQLLDDEYRPITGWRQEWPVTTDIDFTGHEPHIEGYVEAKRNGGLELDGREDLWNKGYWEAWKGEYREHVADVVKPEYDLTDLTAANVESLLDDLGGSTSTSLSTSVPAYMLGGRQGGIIWSGFKNRSLENPEEAAAVLSHLFDDEAHVNLRLDRFGSFYGELDEGGGQLMSLATILLTFVYPREYVMYRWGLMSTFFGEFADYKVRTGFNTDQYWKLNVACKHQLLIELDRELDDATMLDVHTLLYVFDREHADQ